MREDAGYVQECTFDLTDSVACLAQFASYGVKVVVDIAVPMKRSKVVLQFSGVAAQWTQPS